MSKKINNFQLFFEIIREKIMIANHLLKNYLPPKFLAMHLQLNLNLCIQTQKEQAVFQSNCDT